MNKLAILKMSKKKIISVICIIATFTGGCVVGAQIYANASNNAVAVLPIAKGGTGNALGAAQKMAAQKTFALTGDVTGSVASDLSGDVSIATSSKMQMPDYSTSTNLTCAVTTGCYAPRKGYISVNSTNSINNANCYLQIGNSTMYDFAIDGATWAYMRTAIFPVSTSDKIIPISKSGCSYTVRFHDVKFV
jgi:hypothetical protein